MLLSKYLKLSIVFFRKVSTNKNIKIYEVAPRDGLQNEKKIITTQEKLKFVDLLADSGLKYIEITSFVSPEWIPQLADSMEVAQQIKRRPGVTYSALVPNITGFNKALKSGLKEIAVFGAASESFSKKNINCSIDESFRRFDPVMKAALANNINIRGYISCVIECPYEGKIDASKVAPLVTKLFDKGCYEVSLGDTIGMGKPNDWKRLIEECQRSLYNIDMAKIAIHCHDSIDGQSALNNVNTALEMGIRTVDSSTGGIGGCPYADGVARGNISTETLLNFLHTHGYYTGVDLSKIQIASEYIKNILHNTPSSHIKQ